MCGVINHTPEAIINYLANIYLFLCLNEIINERHISRLTRYLQCHLYREERGCSVFEV